MIDYEKLKIAHELAEKIDGFCEFTIYANACSADLFKINHTKIGLGWQHNECYLCIDELIAKLKELTQPEPKYKNGDEVWWCSGAGKTISSSVILSITNESQGILYHFDKPYYRDAFEIDCYPSKQSLIEAQIEYWNNLKVNEISASTMCPKCGMQRVADGTCWSSVCYYKECQHESDGLHYDTSKQFIEYGPIDKSWQELLDMGCHNKCKKCGEFYK